MKARYPGVCFCCQAKIAVNSDHEQLQIPREPRIKWTCPSCYTEISEGKLVWNPTARIYEPLGNRPLPHPSEAKFPMRDLGDGLILKESADCVQIFDRDQILWNSGDVSFTAPGTDRRKTAWEVRLDADVKAMLSNNTPNHRLVSAAARLLPSIRIAVPDIDDDGDRSGYSPEQSSACDAEVENELAREAKSEATTPAAESAECEPSIQDEPTLIDEEPLAESDEGIETMPAKSGELMTYPKTGHKLPEKLPKRGKRGDAGFTGKLEIGAHNSKFRGAARWYPHPDDPSVTAVIELVVDYTNGTSAVDIRKSILRVERTASEAASQLLSSLNRHRSIPGGIRKSLGEQLTKMGGKPEAPSSKSESPTAISPETPATPSAEHPPAETMAADGGNGSEQPEKKKQSRERKSQFDPIQFDKSAPPSGSSSTPAPETREPLPGQMSLPEATSIDGRVDLVTRLYGEIRRVAREECELLIASQDQSGNRSMESPGGLRIEIRPPVGKPVNMTGPLHPQFQTVLELCAQRINVLLIGPTQCGKTTLAEQIAKAMGLPFYAIHCSLGMSESSFKGRLYPGSNGPEFLTVPFLEGYTKGGVVLIDEIDAASAEVLIAPHQALSGDNWFNDLLPAGRQCISRHPDFVAIATANTWGLGANRMYVAKQQLDFSTLQRFAFGQVELGYSAEIEAAVCPDDKLRDALLKIRQKLENRNRDTLSIRKAMTTRFLAEAYRMNLAGWTIERCCEQFFRSWSDDERAIYSNG